jgi:iron complex outermembrane recepter protein
MTKTLSDGAPARRNNKNEGNAMSAIRIRYKWAMVLTVLLSMSGTAPALAVNLDSQVSLEIPAQSLANALLALSKQASIQLVTSAETLPAGPSEALTGTMSIRAALDRLLRNTDLSYKWAGEHTVTVIRRTPAASVHTSAAIDRSPEDGDEGMGTKTAPVYRRVSLSTTLTAEAAAGASSAPAASSQDSLDAVVVTGTRQTGLKAVDSPAPIQIISADALKAASGNPDLMSTLSQIVPSMTMQAIGFDMAGQTLQAKLRGLSPNHVLVLVNGKRRHTTANIAIDLGSPYQGGAGVDLNFIPLDAIDHIEVLTEGAAAQYGTDAIAGVINIILKRSSSGGSVSGTYGNYMNGGGNTGDVSGNAGFGLSNNGYFNLTGEVHNHGHSNQGAVDERVINPANLATYPGSNLPNVPGYPYMNQIFGDAESHLKIAALNSGFDFDDGTEVYLSATYGDKRAASYENYRLPTAVQFTDPLTGVTTYPFPYGFNPREATKETDYSLTGGVKGVVAGWNWDVAMTYGGDKVNIFTLDSANAGTFAINGVPTPSDYYDGFLKTTQWTTTADFNRDFDVGLAGPLNVAFGAEYRRETYSIGAGVPLSYLDGGAQSYPGFTPTDAGINDRKNYAGYVDFAAKPIDGLRIDAAGRFEHYSDFGNATVGKLTGRYDFDPQFAVRGTISNGFRAPTLAEEFYSSTTVTPTTAFVQLAPNSPGGKLLGLGEGLQPEKSVNYSIGLAWRPIPQMSATLDLYQITITNRIVGSGQLVGYHNGNVVSSAVNAAIVANGNQLDPTIVQSGLTGVNVFANGIDTRTRGADLVFDFPAKYSFGSVVWSIGATYNDTSVTKIPTTPAILAGQPLYDQEALSDLSTATPKYIVNLGALLTAGKLSINLQEKIYGPSSDYEVDNGDNGGTGPGTFQVCPTGPCTGSLAYYKNEIGLTPITNLDVSYQFTEHLKLAVGALNLFDRFPPLLNTTLRAHGNSFAYGDNFAVSQYPQFSPLGINGGFYYVKAVFTF